MNKQEALKRIEVQKETLIRLTGWAVYVYIEGLIKSLDEPQPVKVKQFVADWYEENKDDFEGNLYRCAHNIPSVFDGAKLNEFERWFLLASTKSFQTLVNMHQFGYEVEEEKKFFVKIKCLSEEYKYLNYFKSCREWLFSQKEETEEYRTAHTRKELEDANLGWVFDCPGIEIEEVEYDTNA